MALLLNIDCATNNASVSISDNNNVLAYRESGEQKEHASFLHTSVKDICINIGINLNDISAISTIFGPGSYTGLRVGMASAKGFCYSLNKPFITLNTLDVMAYAAITTIAGSDNSKENVLYCPMIDARRMEVFTGLYDYKLEKIVHPHAIEISSNTFISYVEKNRVYCFGSGSNKCREILNNNNFLFVDVQHTCQHVAALSYKAFINNNFADLAYSEPLYLKEFYSTQKG